jgi:uncharacterized membrane protein
MDIEIGLIALATVGLIALVIAGILAIRHKNVAPGLMVVNVVLFASMLTFGMVGSLYLYNHYVPERIQIQVGEFFSIVGPLTMSVVFFLRFRRSKIAGNLVANGQTKNTYLSQGVAILLLLYCIVPQLTDVNQGEVVKRNVFWWIVAICLGLYLHYSTEWCEKGFVYRGKAIPFSDIAHAQWDSQWSKTKLKIKLKNNEHELALNIPSGNDTSNRQLLPSQLP